jgi:hypothetical protein
MSQADHILRQIDQLSLEELQYLWLQVQRRMQRVETLRETLTQIMGSGAGLWSQDAQDWVNENRADER